MYSIISRGVSRGAIWGIQRLFSKALYIVIFFLLDLLNSEFSNFSIPQLFTTVEEANNSMSRLSQGKSSLLHVFSFCHQWNHSRWSHNTVAKRSRSRISNPPFNFGETCHRSIDDWVVTIDFMVSRPSIENSVANDRSFWLTISTPRKL